MAATASRPTAHRLAQTLLGGQHLTCNAALREKTPRYLRAQQYSSGSPLIYRRSCNSLSSSSSSISPSTTIRPLSTRNSSTSSVSSASGSSSPSSPKSSTDSSRGTPDKPHEASDSDASSTLPPGWEDSRTKNISDFSELPYREFGFNQHMVINAEFKEALRQVLWQFRAPIRYAFAYGSGVFTQSDVSPSQSTRPSPHPNAPEAVAKWQASGSGAKTIDFIFGVSFTQHWHSLNLQQHRDHYSFLGSLGSGVVSNLQDNFGAGAYFNPYVTVNGLMIKYGVVNLDTIYEDLSSWKNLYIAGRLQKPVKILRDDARIRLANQVNLISALRTALLMLPEQFSERDLYRKIAGLSYMGDPRMFFGAEHPYKVSNIVDPQMTNFRQLYLPLIEDLPNVTFADQREFGKGWTGDPNLNCLLQQDMDPYRRGNMVRRLPQHFRHRLYEAYQQTFKIPLSEYEALVQESRDENTFSRSEGGEFDRRIATRMDIDRMLVKVVRKTVTWPAAVESGKGLLSAGIRKSWRYFLAKRAKGRAQRKTEKEKAKGGEKTKAESSPGVGASTAGKGSTEKQ